MPDDTTAPVTAEDLAQLFHDTYERLAPDHGYETRQDSAVPWENVPAANKSLMIAVAGRVLAALAGDPGDLPARMAEAIDATWTSEEDFDAEKAAAAAMSVRWEHAAAQAAEVERLRAELAEVKTERDTNFSVLQRVSKGGWETATELVNERIARQQAERELTEAKQAIYTAQITHIREWHPNYAHVGACAGCQVLVPLSRDLPSRPDDPEEIRRLAQATTEETNDG